MEHFMNKSIQNLVLLVAFGLICSFTSNACAHHIWIAKSKETGKVNIYFGEDPSPDQDMFLNGIKGMQVWSVDSTGAASEIAFTRKTKGKDGWFETADGLDAVDANCEYGVFGRGDANMFLHYCAKWVKFAPGAAAKSTGKLPIDIVMSTSESKTVFTVLHKQKPAAGCELRIIEDNKDEHDLIANEAGQVEFDKVPGGRWMLKARVVEKVSGEHKGKKYGDKRFFCTMVIDAPRTIAAGKTEETQTSAKTRTAMLSSKTPFPELPVGITSFGGRSSTNNCTFLADIVAMLMNTTDPARTQN